MWQADRADRPTQVDGLGAKCFSWSRHLMGISEVSHVHLTESHSGTCERFVGGWRRHRSGSHAAYGVTMTTPFDDLADESPATGTESRRGLLDAAKRGYVPIRKGFVQRPNTSPVRASVLGAMVTGRQERAVDALLMVHALQPVLRDDPLPLKVWARLLPRGKVPGEPAVAAAAFRALQRRHLVDRGPRGRNRFDVRPLMEDGSGDPWTRPGQDAATVGHGFFTIPHDYWNTGLADELGFPGKAMFLITLSETTRQPTFAMAYERAPQWYGISERTAERGFEQLRRAGVLLEHRQLVRSSRSPTGLREIWHRALADPYSTDSRNSLQRVSRAASRGQRPTGTSAAADPGGVPTSGPVVLVSDTPGRTEEGRP